MNKKILLLITLTLTTQLLAEFTSKDAKALSEQIAKDRAAMENSQTKAVTQTISQAKSNQPTDPIKTKTQLLNEDTANMLKYQQQRERMLKRRVFNKVYSDKKNTKLKLPVYQLNNFSKMKNSNNIHYYIKEIDMHKMEFFFNEAKRELYLKAGVQYSQQQNFNNQPLNNLQNQENDKSIEVVENQNFGNFKLKKISKNLMIFEMVL